MELLGRVIAEKGHNGGEIYMFADKDEANAFIAELRAKMEFKNAWLLPVKQ